MKGLDNIYTYDRLYEVLAICTVSVHFCLSGGIAMRIILDTEKKTITVPWNYTDKLK